MYDGTRPFYPLLGEQECKSGLLRKSTDADKGFAKARPGGIEYLFSVPSSVGGAVYMNAGRGKSEKKTISDYLVSVEYFSPINSEFRTYDMNVEEFSHRHSPFQETEDVIVSATFKFKEQDAETTETLIKERMEHSKRYLSAEKPSCGSVFCEGNRLMDGLRMGLPILVHKVSARGYNAFWDRPYFKIYDNRDSFKNGLNDLLKYCKDNYEPTVIQGDYLLSFSFQAGCSRMSEAMAVLMGKK